MVIGLAFSANGRASLPPVAEGGVARLTIRRDLADCESVLIPASRVGWVEGGVLLERARTETAAVYTQHGWTVIGTRSWVFIGGAAQLVPLCLPSAGRLLLKHRTGAPQAVVAGSAPADSSAPIDCECRSVSVQVMRDLIEAMKEHLGEGIPQESGARSDV